MTNHPEPRDATGTALPDVTVRGRIRLGQFLKLADLVEDGAQARIAVQYGDVTVNGVVEARRGHVLNDGDAVVVALPSGTAGAVVRQVGEPD